jgi:hypothetical protein
VDVNSVDANKQTYLSGMETMDEDEFNLLLAASNLQVRNRVKLSNENVHLLSLDYSAAPGPQPSVHKGVCRRH